ncbi:MAG: leucine-rich repeat domain-containing protein [Spirochaetaceae bacterium]|nr:leucine-rich repeat domain-containing protein [Spirochaetaceae bacterium]
MSKKYPNTSGCCAAALRRFGFDWIALVCAIFLSVSIFSFTGCNDSSSPDSPAEPDSPVKTDGQDKPKDPGKTDKPDTPDAPKPSETPKTVTITGVNALKSYLDGMPENSETTPYEIVLNGVDLSSVEAGDTFKGLLGALSRFTALDLRGCTGGKISGVTGKAGANKEKIVSLILPDTVISIEDGGGVTTGVFSKCTALVSVSLPKVASIGKYAFYGCASLKSIALPEAVSIESKAFQAGSKDAVFTVGSAVPPAITADTFTASKIAKVYVPAGSVEAYKNAEHWTKLKEKIMPVNP